MNKLPMDQVRLENFIMHHIHAWTQEVYEENDKGITFTEKMDAQFSSFVVELADRFRGEVLPRFEEV